MKSSHIDMHRAATPTLESGAANTVNPAPAEASDKAISISELRMCPIPPLHDNPFLNYADADQKILNWLYNGVKPQSLKEVNDWSSSASGRSCRMRCRGWCSNAKSTN